MTPRTPKSVAVLGLLLFTMTARASMQTSPAKPAQTGAAVITGFVTDDGVAAKPLRNVTVTASGSGLLFGRSTLTDADGKFTISNLPAGQFTVDARKLGLVRTWAGSKRPGVGPGSAVVVADGQRATVTLKMVRTAVIAGTVRLPSGTPATMVRVQALRFTVVNGERRLVQSNGAWSVDDRGEFRIYGLLPGDYVVAVAPAANALAEVRTISAEEMQWALRQFQPNAAASAAPTPTATLPLTSAGFSPVYFPGTVEGASATAITLKPGEERSGVDVPLQFVPMARIEGTIVDADGRPAKSVEARLVTSEAFSAPGPTPAIRPGPDGRFTLTSIAPGRYRLFARGASSSATPPPRPEPGVAPVPPTLPLWALMELNVNGADLTGLTVQLQPGLRVAGSVAFEGDGAMPSDLSRVRVTLSAIQRTGGVTVGVGPVQANADGTFAFEGIVPGFYRLSAAMSGTPGGATWTLKSSVSGERESQDVGIEVAPARDITDAVVTLTNRPAELVGSLIDATGRPAPDFHVIAFSVDRAHWTNQHWRIAQARPATNGAFRIAGLPPGEYFLGAVTDVEPDQIYDPTLLEQLQKSAVKISIASGQKTTQNLRIAGSG